MKMLTAVVPYHWGNEEVDVIIKFKECLSTGYDVIAVYWSRAHGTVRGCAPDGIWHAVGEHLRQGGELKDAMDAAVLEERQLDMFEAV